MINPFFKNNGPLKIFDILKILNLDLHNNLKDQKVLDIKDLSSIVNVLLFGKLVEIYET